MTIRSLLEQHAQEIPDAEALRSYEGKEWVSRTFAEFLADVRRTGSAYGTAFALRPREENAALILQNSPTWMEVYLACSGAGVAVVPVDPKLHNDEVAYILQDSGAVVVTTDRSHLDMMRAIVPDLPSVRAVVLVDGEGEYEAIGSVPVRALAALRADVRDASWYDAHVAAADDVASIIYTSGTTGKPKGAMLTHGNFTADAVGALEAHAGGHVPRGAAALPRVFVLHELRRAAPDGFGDVLRALALHHRRGREAAAPHGGDGRAAPRGEDLRQDRRETQGVEEGAVPDEDRTAPPRVRRGEEGPRRTAAVHDRGRRAGAPCPKHVLEGFKKLGITMLEGYGLTECAPVVSIAGPKCARIGTIGAKIANIEIRLADQNGQGVGELQVKGPITMKGYWCNDAATKEAFDGEWLKTGDLASVADDGLITIRGRKKALIVNREGKNIYPEEVENRIAADPVVADCVVVGYTTGGVPGEKVGCVVHPDMDLLAARNGGKEVAWEEAEKIAQEHVHAQCHDLADYKRVRKIVVSKDPLERTSIQKVRRVAYKGMLNE